MTRDHGPATNDLRPGAALSATALVVGLLVCGSSAGLAQEPTETPQSRAIAKMTPAELFGEAHFLVDSGKPGEAVPYLVAFTKTQPDDQVFLELREKFGPGALLRLSDFPETAPYAAPLLARLAEAQKNFATRPDRVARFVRALHATPAEQKYAVDRLREAGPYAVPAIVEALQDSALSATDRARVAVNLGRLDRSAVPPLIAALDSDDPALVGTVAGALGAIGDRRAVPYLTIRAAQADQDAPGQMASRQAIARITGLHYGGQPKSPQRLLVEEAWKYHRHQVGFPAGEVEIWNWDADRKTPVPATVQATDAEALLGLRMAREALNLDPADLSAQTALVSLALDKAIARSGGLDKFSFNGQDPSGAFAAALASGPVVLTEVLKAASADGHSDLAAVAAIALGRVTDRDGLAVTGRTSPLVEALSAPDRRIQFAAAKALIDLGPERKFAGSSRVVPVLARFLGDPAAPRAVIIDGNVGRGNRVAGSLRKIGVDPIVSTTGEEGFRIAASQADVELIVLDPTNLQGAWLTVDTLTNLRADARTAGIPIFVLYPVDSGRYPSAAERLRPHPDVEPNNSQRLANPILYSGGVKQATILGQIGSGDSLGDYFRLGNLDPGMSVSVDVQLPEGSKLRIQDVAVTIEASGDKVLAQTSLGRANLDITASDTYYLRVQAPEGLRGAGSTYRLNITLIDPLTLQYGNERALGKLESMIQGLPRVVPIALSADPVVLKRQVTRELNRLGIRPLSGTERAAYAQAAAQLLGQIGQRPGSPFASDLAQVGPALSAALHSPSTAPAAAVALADVPGLDAQRGLADAVLDPGKPTPFRLNAASQLARSLGRFGDLVTAEQEALLVQQLDRETDPALKTALSLVVGSLRPHGATVGNRLKTFQLAPGATPPPTAPEGDEPGMEPGEAEPAPAGDEPSTP